MYAVYDGKGMAMNVSRLRNTILCAAFGTLLLHGFARAGQMAADPLIHALIPLKFLGQRAISSFIEPGGRSAFFGPPPRPADINLTARPGLIGRRALPHVTVYQLFPNDGLIFPAKSAVTIGWLPVKEGLFDMSPAIIPRYPSLYEVVIQRHDRQFHIKKFVVTPNQRSYSTLFFPPGPGRYRWMVRAVYTRTTGVPSEFRYFTVLP